MMTLDKTSLALLQEALTTLEAGFDELPDFAPAVDMVALKPILEQVAQRMQDNYPYQHPLYAGQMLKPPHPVARLAYMLALYINPNNHALDGGRASSAMEKEAVADIAAMFGWQTHLGHLTSGGTMANLEALWIAGALNPGMKIVASQQAHYTHSRISSVLNLRYKSVAVDEQGRMDLKALEDMLQAGDIGTVVVTMGTTATGAVDPLPEILALQAEYGFRIHADAAYGGYFRLLATAPDTLPQATRAAFNRIHDVDSIVVDPHKHGLQPYGCGCVLFKDPAVGTFYKHDSPYTYFSSNDLHLGEISLECSRAGASAVALWATHQLLPPIEGGDFADGLTQARQAAVLLHQKLADDARFVVPFAPELDIVVWAVKAQSVETMSQLAQAIFEEAARQNLHLAVTKLPVAFFPDMDVDYGNAPTITCLRSCLMKPEHADWLDRIWQILDATTTQVLATQANETV